MSNKARVYLYKEGNECTTVSGGWGSASGGTYEGESTGTISYKKESNRINIRIVANSLTGHAYSIYNNKVIDFTPFNYVYMDADIGHNDQWDRGYLYVVNSSKNSTYASYTLKASTDLERQIFTFDVSAAGTGYIRLNPNTVINGRYGEIILYNCYMESTEDVISISNNDRNSFTARFNNLNGVITLTGAKVLINGNVVKTYTGDVTSITYNYDKTLMNYGENTISVQASYKDKNNIVGEVDYTLELPYIKYLLSEDIITIKSQNESSINFSCDTFENMIVINKADVYINDELCETYTDGFNELIYTYDENLVGIINGLIKVEFVQDGETIVAEKAFSQCLPIKIEQSYLPENATWQDVEIKKQQISETLRQEKILLESILQSKNIKTSSDDSLASLIFKVNELNNNNDNTWLYRTGNEFVDITGGFLSHAHGGNYLDYLQITKNLGHISFEASHQYLTNYGVCTINKIDLTNYKTINAIMKVTEESSLPFSIIVTTSIPTDQDGSNVIDSCFEYPTALEQETFVTMDVSNLVGNYYILFVHQNETELSKACLISAWLEK